MLLCWQTLKPSYLVKVDNYKIPHIVQFITNSYITKFIETENVRDCLELEKNIEMEDNLVGVSFRDGENALKLDNGYGCPSEL